MSIDEEAVEQLTGELLDHVQLLGGALGHDMTEELARLATERASRLVGELSRGRDPSDTAARIIRLLWPDGEKPPIMWWGIALGVMIAAAASDAADPGWSIGEAAAVLRVRRRRIVGMVKDGVLLPGGRGVSRWSVIAEASHALGAGNAPRRLNPCSHLPEARKLISCTVTIMGEIQPWPSDEQIKAEFGEVAVADTIHLCEHSPARRIWRALGSKEEEGDTW